MLLCRLELCLGTCDRGGCIGEILLLRLDMILVVSGHLKQIKGMERRWHTDRTYGCCDVIELQMVEMDLRQCALRCESVSVVLKED